MATAYHGCPRNGEVQLGHEPQVAKSIRAKFAGLGVALGAGVGTAIGVAVGNLAVWLPVGIAIGVGIGVAPSRRGQSSGRGDR